MREKEKEGTHPKLSPSYNLQKGRWGKNLVCTVHKCKNGATGGGDKENLESEQTDKLENKNHTTVMKGGKKKRERDSFR